MQRRARLSAAIAACVLLMVGLLPGTSVAQETPFVTSKPAQLIALAEEVVITPILSAGDVIGQGARAYQMSGIPDGLGLYRSGPDTVEVWMNHELDGDPSNARVSHLTLNNAGEVIDAEYVIDGREKFKDFCSSTLEIIGGTHWYFTGEEANDSIHGGTSIAINAETGDWVETRHFGLMLHENVVPVQSLSEAVVFLAEDGRHNHNQIYVYIAGTFKGAIAGRGQLMTWVPTGKTDGAPSNDDLSAGQSLRGELVPISQRDNDTVTNLNAAAEAAGALNFVRIEDATSDPTHPGVVYFAETGAARSESYKGRIFKLRFDPEDPTKARLSVVLDADEGADMFNPDNLGISARTLMIQEDRNYARSGYNRVLSYDPLNGTLTPLARTDPRPIAIERDGGPGAWESSGVVDASTLFGEGWWLLDVQDDEYFVSYPGPSLRVDSAEGEGGQLLAMFVPGS
jgi:secreted PhoX family phosphatase